VTIACDVKDLGVIVDSHLSFDAHISKTVARAFTRANLIHKCIIQGIRQLYGVHLLFMFDRC